MSIVSLQIGLILYKKLTIKNKKMKSKLILLASTVLILQSCSSVKEQESTFWVSGYKVEASAGAGKMETLLINENEDVNAGTWKNFYAPIEGFQYEEGYLKQIKVKKEELDKETVPADASSIKYTLAEEISKITDNRALLNGEWLVAKINGHVINRMTVLPTMTIDLSKNSVSGSDGCNNYSGSFSALTQNELKLSPLASTRKACINENIATEYYKALAEVKSYKIQEKELSLLNDKGELLVTFIKK